VFTTQKPAYGNAYATCAGMKIIAQKCYENENVAQCTSCAPAVLDTTQLLCFVHYRKRRRRIIEMGWNVNWLRGNDWESVGM